jgi:hypothetical protein
MKTAAPELVNRVLKRHVEKLSDWGFAEFVQEMHEWADRFIREFDLGVPVPAIAIERLQKKTLGHYRLNRNAFGLRDEIAIAERHALESPRWKVLGTLLHELLHEWQFVKLGRDQEAISNRGRGGHNREYRAHAAELGLEVSARGVTTYPNPEGGTPFRRLLEKNGVTFDEPEAPPEDPPGKSTLRLWTCSCNPPVKLRAGKAAIEVRCLRCNGDFKCADEEK